MKEKAKKFWEENKDKIVFDAVLIGGFALMCEIGVYYGIWRTANAIGVISEVTPELTFGEFKKQVVDKTFDIAKYK